MGFGKSVSVSRLITVNFGEINERQFQLYDKIHFQKKELHSPGPSALGTWLQGGHSNHSSFIFKCRITFCPFYVDQ